MKKTNLIIIMILVFVKRYNKTMNQIMDILETMFTLLKAAQKSTALQLLHIVAGIAIGKVIEHYLSEIALMVIDIVKIIYKYEVYIYFINSPLLLGIAYIFSWTGILIMDSIVICMQIIAMVMVKIRALKSTPISGQMIKCPHEVALCNRVGYFDLL